jgi:hypothetical protein
MEHRYNPQNRTGYLFRHLDDKVSSIQMNNQGFNAEANQKDKYPESKLLMIKSDYE